MSSMFRNTCTLIFTTLLLMASLVYADEPLELATKLIASQMNVSTSSVGPDKPLSQIGVGGDQLDIVELVMSTEEATNKEITDAHFEEVMGEFDESLSERVTARKLAQIILEL